MSTATMTARRFSFEDLARLVDESSAAELAERLRISARTVHRYRHRGLTVLQADRLAVAAGFHPAEIWPDWY